MRKKKQVLLQKKSLKKNHAKKKPPAKKIPQKKTPTQKKQVILRKKAVNFPLREETCEKHAKKMGKGGEMW